MYRWRPEYFPRLLLLQFQHRAWWMTNENMTTTHAIIDCTEIFTPRPSSLFSNAQLFSSYKSHATFKGLIGIASHGPISMDKPLLRSPHEVCPFGKRSPRKNIVKRKSGKAKYWLIHQWRLHLKPSVTDQRSAQGNLLITRMMTRKLTRVFPILLLI